MRHVSLAAIFACLAALTLGSCSGGSSPTSPRVTATPTQTASPTPAPTPTATATASIAASRIPAKLVLSIDAQPTVKTPSAPTLTIVGYDAGGTLTSGPGTYPTILLTNDDKTGTVVLGTTTASVPNANVPIAYNGAWIATGNASANITATVAGTNVSATLAVSPQPLLTWLDPMQVPANIIPNAASFTSGPDGALWLIQNSAQITNLTLSGVKTNYTLPSGITAAVIVPGPNNELWFSSGENANFNIGSISTSGQITTCPLGSNAARHPYILIDGKDSAMWFLTNTMPGTAATVGRVSTTCEETDYPVPLGDLRQIALGPDDAFYITQSYFEGSYPHSYIGRLTRDGSLTEYAMPHVGDYPEGITNGPDGEMWFVNFQKGIGRISTSGKITETATNPVANPQGSITVGPDGAMWFDTTDGLARISATGQITDYPLATTTITSGTSYSAFGLQLLQLGPENALYGEDFLTYRIGRISI